MEQSKNSQLRVAIFTAKSGGPLSEAIKKNNIKLYEGDFKKGSLNISSYKSCIEIFKNFDIIHIHSFNPIIAFAAIKSGKKIVYTEHGNFGFERKINFTEKINRNLLSTFINKHIDFITFNSNFTQTTSLNRYGLSKTKKQVVYNGIVINSNSVKPTIGKSEIVIGTVGRLASVKRIDRLIEAFSNVKDLTNFKLQIIGDGPLRNTLEALVIERGISSKVEFEGFRTNLNDYFENWDLVVIPSSGEAFGLVVLEAYNCGTPVAVFNDGGGMIEIVQKCDPGLIVSSIDELVSLIESLPFVKEKLHATYEKEKRKKLTYDFSITTMEKQLYSIYISL
jgi:glycosyltransferase involved in cell wall biosynthesis